MSNSSDTDGGTAATQRTPVRPSDIFFYAPLGALFESLDQVTHLAELGRERAEGTIHNARFLGQMTAQFGRSELEKRFGGIFGGRGRRLETTSSNTPSASDRSGQEDDTAGKVTRREPVEVLEAEQDPAPVVAARIRNGSSPTSTNGLRPTVSLAIPDYDTLSASQVVRRLDGLSAGELRAVAHYEGATRSRRTILNRAEQLLGSHDGAEPRQAGSSSETATS